MRCSACLTFEGALGFFKLATLFAHVLSMCCSVNNATQCPLRQSSCLSGSPRWTPLVAPSGTALMLKTVRRPTLPSRSSDPAWPPPRRLPRWVVQALRALLRWQVPRVLLLYRSWSLPVLLRPEGLVPGRQHSMHDRKPVVSLWLRTAAVCCHGM